MAEKPAVAGSYQLSMKVSSALMAAGSYSMANGEMKRKPVAG